MGGEILDGNLGGRESGLKWNLGDRESGVRSLESGVWSLEAGVQSLEGTRLAEPRDQRKASGSG